MADPTMIVSELVQFLEDWIPGIGENTKLHDELHKHFGLDYTVNSEAKLLGFQLGHHPAGNFSHVIAFTAMSTTIYPEEYRNKIDDIKDFYKYYLLGKRFQGVPYYFIPKTIFN